MMTFTELLDLLVSRASLNEGEMKDARELIQELKSLNAFGVVLGNTEVGHKCVPTSQWPPYICKICRKGIENV